MDDTVSAHQLGVCRQVHRITVRRQPIRWHVQAKARMEATTTHNEDDRAGDHERARMEATTTHDVAHDEEER